MHDSSALMSSYIGHQCLPLCDLKKKTYTIWKMLAVAHPQLTFERCRCAGLAVSNERIDRAPACRRMPGRGWRLSRLWHETAGKVGYFILVCLTLWNMNNNNKVVTARENILPSEFVALLDFFFFGRKRFVFCTTKGRRSGARCWREQNSSLLICNDMYYVAYFAINWE